MSQSVLKIDDDILNRVRSNIPKNTSPFEQGGDEEKYRFICFVCDYLRGRKKLNLMPDLGVSYFVFVPPECVRDLENEGEGVASLRKNKGFDLPGKLFLCLDSSLNKVRVISCSSDDIRNDLEECFQEIEGVCGQSLLHAVVDFQHQNISAYLSEIYAGEDQENEILIGFGGEQERFSHEKLNQFSHDFHERETKLPTCGMMVWRNQSKFELTDKVEERIALRFALTLSAILGKDYVSQETRGAHGRVDLVIHTGAMVEELGPCVLEFKVLRNSDGPSKCEEWLQSGILQVLDYGKDRNARSHYLMVYDGRESLGKLKTIEGEAAKNDIIYLHFEMYNTTDGERKLKMNKS